MGIDEFVAGMTVVAFGTSTPELFAGTLAGIRGRTAVTLCNILGSNSFNILVILRSDLGPGTGPPRCSRGTTGLSSCCFFSLFMYMVLQSLRRGASANPGVAQAEGGLLRSTLWILPGVLLLVMFTGRRRLLLDRWEGALFIAAYGAYLAYVLIRR
ncbi:MAG: hypothetical protein ACOC8N_06750 [Spirochaetota bacterium]